MDPISARHNLSDSLNRLIAFDAQGRALWPADELKSLLAQQLQSNLPDLAPGADPLTLADLLHHPQPPLDLLRRVKDFAKFNRFDAASPLPPEVALLLYYGTIAVALIRLNQRITHLSDEDLRDGLAWVLRQPWVDERTLCLFRDGLDHLRAGRHHWRR